MHSSRYRFDGWFFSPRRLYGEVWAVWRACFVLVVQVSVGILVVGRGQLEKRTSWYVTDKLFCAASYLTCSLLLIYTEPVAPVVYLAVTFEYC